MIQHIQFEGDTALCGRWLPFAQSKLGSLSRLYAGRRNWVWETVAGDVRIGLERNGPVTYIRIRAATGGYEFITAFAKTLAGGFTDLKFGTVGKGKDDEGEQILVQRSRAGLPFDLENDGYSDQLDKYLFGREWQDRLAGGKNYTTPKMDWFAVSLPDPEDIEEVPRREARGYSGGKWAITVPTDSRRYVNVTGQYSYVWIIGASSYYNEVAFDYLDYSISVDDTVLHRRSKKSKTQYAIGNDVWSAAVQNGFIIGGADRGELYGFFAYHMESETYFPIDLYTLRPAWLWGTSRTRWYWRGDGQRCISLQYDAYSTEPDKLLLQNVVVDVTIHELEFILEGVDETTGYLVGAISDKFATRNHGVYPVAVDYDLFNPRVRRVIVLEHWIGPQYDRMDEFDEHDDLEKSRALLIYACFCTVDDSGAISAPYRRIPVYHKPWLVTVDPSYWEPGELTDPITDEFGYVMVERCTPQGISEFHADFGYHGFCARIAAMDARAQAIALYGQLQTETYPPTPLPSVEYEFKHNKRWLIWNEDSYREDAWVSDDGLPYAPFTAPLAAIATPPAGYTRYIDTHPLYTDGIIAADINAAHEEILRTQHPQGMTQVMYDGFRVSPEKHFALYVHEGSDFYTHPDFFNWQVQAIPDPVKPFLHFDHVEWFALDDEGEPAPLTSTHQELFNAARETEYEYTDAEIESMCANGFWGR